MDSQDDGNGVSEAIESFPMEMEEMDDNAVSVRSTTPLAKSAPRRSPRIAKLASKSKKRPLSRTSKPAKKRKLSPSVSKRKPASKLKPTLKRKPATKKPRKNRRRGLKPAKKA